MNREPTEPSAEMGPAASGAAGSGPQAARIGRRAFLGAGAALGGLGALSVFELWKLRGGLDHRQLPRVGSSAFSRSLESVADDQDALLHIGHSTHLLSLTGVRVLTDPWFYDPAHGGMEHARGPATGPAELPELDVVLITHEHPDHADPVALDRLDKRALVVVPTAELAAQMRALGYRLVETLEPWRSIEHRGLTITATPAIHDVTEIGYVTERESQRVYFAGDTALHPHMERIAETFSPTVAILPVDGTELAGDRRWVMNPAEAAEAARLLGAGTVIPSHADATFTGWVLRAWARAIPDAATGLRAAMAQATPNARCVLPNIGGPIELASG